jgi:hypothetical protein
MHRNVYLALVVAWALLGLSNSVAFDDEFLDVIVTFGTGTFDPNDYRLILRLDTDQDITTGRIDNISGRDAMPGVDFDVRSGTSEPSPSFGSIGVGNVFKNGVGVVGSVPIDFGDDSLAFSVPLSLIEDDGDVDYVLSVQDSRKDLFVQNTDFAPDTGTAQSIPSLLPVGVDIKPDSHVNSVNPGSRGVLPVAILGTDTFDVADVDITTLAFGPAGALPAHRNGPHAEDVNLDGFPDLLGHFPIEEAGLVAGDVEACVTGETLDGTPFKGCDSVHTVPSKRR